MDKLRLKQMLLLLLLWLQLTIYIRQIAYCSLLVVQAVAVDLLQQTTWSATT